MAQRPINQILVSSGLVYVCVCIFSNSCLGLYVVYLIIASVLQAPVKWLAGNARF